MPENPHYRNPGGIPDDPNCPNTVLVLESVPEDARLSGSRQMIIKCVNKFTLMVAAYHGENAVVQKLLQELSYR